MKWNETIEIMKFNGYQTETDAESRKICGFKIFIFNYIALYCIRVIVIIQAQFHKLRTKLRFHNSINNQNMSLQDSQTKTEKLFLIKKKKTISKPWILTTKDCVFIVGFAFSSNIFSVLIYISGQTINISVSILIFFFGCRGCFFSRFASVYRWMSTFTGIFHFNWPLLFRLTADGVKDERKFSNVHRTFISYMMMMMMMMQQRVSGKVFQTSLKLHFSISLLLFLFNSFCSSRLKQGVNKKWCEDILKEKNHMLITIENIWGGVD